MTPIQKSIYHASRTEFAKYLFAGTLTFLADFLVLLVLTEVVGVSYLWSNLVGVSVGVVVSYFLCVNFVFKERRYSSVTFEFSFFTITCLVGIFLNSLLLWAFVEFGGIHYLVSKVFVTGVIFVVNFYLKKILLFQT